MSRSCRVSCLILTVLVLGGAIVAAEKNAYSREMLLHPFLSDQYAQWLVGPIARLAGDEGIAAYLAVPDDAAAAAFITAFWEKNAELLELYESRARVADQDFEENHLPGRRTDRGTIWILYGAPESQEYEEFNDVSEPPVMIWAYPKGSEKGLDGKKPKRSYRFARQGDTMVFYQPPSEEELQRRARFNSTGN